MFHIFWFIVMIAVAGVVIFGKPYRGDSNDS